MLCRRGWDTTAARKARPRTRRLVPHPQGPGLSPRPDLGQRLFPVTPKKLPGGDRQAGGAPLHPGMGVDSLRAGEVGRLPFSLTLAEAVYTPHCREK